MAQTKTQPTAWESFKADPRPTAKIRELHAALEGAGPGLNAMFAEWRERGTVLGVPTLTVAGRPYLPRQKIARRIEGTE